ncbi:MAG: redoxin domain-containing protein, partial [Myxococcales bacterium]|nr:redoxin domain-containing protein [Myxococcales bacterium]
MTEETRTVTLPRLNEPAPQFTAPSTAGEIKLSDYKGKWVVLFSHPADFTPVCTT